MADYCGRRLGLPSVQINPGMGVKVYRRDEELHPAVSSVTARTLDLVSFMEAVHARDRQASAPLDSPPAFTAARWA